MRYLHHVGGDSTGYLHSLERNSVRAGRAMQVVVAVHGFGGSNDSS